MSTDVCKSAAWQAGDCSPQPAAARKHALRAGLRRWWQRMRMDEMTAYLSQATSHVDLEQRMRAWDERERWVWMPLP